MRLVATVNFAIIPGLIDENQDQNHVQATDTDTDPEDLLPTVSAADHEVAD